MLALAVDDYLQSINCALEVFQFVDKFVNLQLGDTSKAQIQNRLRLTFAKVKCLSKFDARITCGSGIFDNFDYFVDVLYGNNKTFDDVSSFLGLFKFVLGTTQNYFALVVYVVGNDIQQAHELRFTIGNGNHVDTIGHL